MTIVNKKKKIGLLLTLGLCVPCLSFDMHEVLTKLKPLETVPPAYVSLLITLAFAKKAMQPIPEPQTSVIRNIIRPAVAHRYDPANNSENKVAFTANKQNKLPLQLLARNEIIHHKQSKVVNSFIIALAVPIVLYSYNAVSQKAFNTLLENIDPESTTYFCVNKVREVQKTLLDTPVISQVLITLLAQKILGPLLPV